MTEPLRIPGDCTVLGTLRCPNGFVPPANSIAGTAITGGLLAEQMEHQFHVTYVQVGGTDVVDATQTIYLATGAGTIEAVEVRPETAPTGGDKAYTVDVKKAANASTSFASILSAPITMNSSDANGTLNTGTLSTTTYSDGDAFQVVVDATGSTGSQGQGLILLVKLREAY